METFRTWLVRLLLPIWLAIYMIGFRMVWVFIFVPIVVAKGIWFATAIAFLVYVVWGTVFYLLIMQGSVFEQAREKLIRLTPKKENRLLTWIKEKFTERKERALISPLWVMITFIVMGVLTGVLVVRISYPRQYLVKALLLIWAGCAVEVLTWFLPVYGGGLVLVKSVIAALFGG